VQRVVGLDRDHHKGHPTLAPNPLSLRGWGRYSLDTVGKRSLRWSGGFPNGIEFDIVGKPTIQVATPKGGKALCIPSGSQ